MDKVRSKSEVDLFLSGKVVTAPELVSKFGSTKVLAVELEIPRLSGAKDRFVVQYANDLGVVLTEGKYIEVHGDIRTVNAKDDDYVIYPYVMASNIKVLDEKPAVWHNEVEIKGAELVQVDEVRGSYSDETKRLVTYRIRTTRKHNRQSTFRVTTWGRDAIFLGNVHKSVKHMDMKCRLESFVSKKNNRLRFGLVTYYLDIPEQEKTVGKVSSVGDTKTEVAPAGETNA